MRFGCALAHLGESRLDSQALRLGNPLYNHRRHEHQAATVRIQSLFDIATKHGTHARLWDLEINISFLAAHMRK